MGGFVCSSTVFLFLCLFLLGVVAAFCICLGVSLRVTLWFSQAIFLFRSSVPNDQGGGSGDFRCGFVFEVLE